MSALERLARELTTAQSVPTGAARLSPLRASVAARMLPAGNGGTPRLNDDEVHAAVAAAVHVGAVSAEEYLELLSACSLEAAAARGLGVFVGQLSSCGAAEFVAALAAESHGPRVLATACGPGLPGGAFDALAPLLGGEADSRAARAPRRVDARGDDGVAAAVLLAATGRLRARAEGLREDDLPTLYAARQACAAAKRRRDEPGPGVATAARALKEALDEFMDGSPSDLPGGMALVTQLLDECRALTGPVETASSMVGWPAQLPAPELYQQPPDGLKETVILALRAVGPRGGDGHASDHAAAEPPTSGRDARLVVDLYAGSSEAAELRAQWAQSACDAPVATLLNGLSTKDGLEPFVRDKLRRCYDHDPQGVIAAVAASKVARVPTLFALVWEFLIAAKGPPPQAFFSSFPPLPAAFELLFPRCITPRDAVARLALPRLAAETASFPLQVLVLVAKHLDPDASAESDGDAKTGTSEESSDEDPQDAALQDAAFFRALAEVPVAAVICALAELTTMQTLQLSTRSQEKADFALEAWGSLASHLGARHADALALAVLKGSGALHPYVLVHLGHPLEDTLSMLLACVCSADPGSAALRAGRGLGQIDLRGVLRRAVPVWSLRKIAVLASVVLPAVAPQVRTAKGPIGIASSCGSACPVTAVLLATLDCLHDMLRDLAACGPAQLDLHGPMEARLARVAAAVFQLGRDVAADPVVEGWVDFTSRLLGLAGIPQSALHDAEEREKLALPPAALQCCQAAAPRFSGSRCPPPSDG